MTLAILNGDRNRSANRKSGTDSCGCPLVPPLRYVNGIIYDYEGAVDQKFTNTYGEDGTYVRSQIRFADGTVSEA